MIEFHGAIDGHLTSANVQGLLARRTKERTLRQRYTSVRLGSGEPIGAWR